MPSNKLSGNLLALEIDGEFVSCETSCEFSFDNDLRGASATNSGGWKEWISGVKSWSISLNAAMLLASAPSDVTTILNAFLFGSRMRIRFRTRFPGMGSFLVVGYVYVQNGGVGASVNTNSTWNTTLQGDGKFSLTDTEQYIGFWGYRISDPYGDEINLIPQFNKYIDLGTASISLDFTTPSSGNYLFAKIPHGQPLFNVWENNQFNFGDIPDYVWHDVVTVGGFDYYMSRSPLYITSAVPVITFRYKNINPNDFAFTAIIDALLSTEYISNEITVSGITEPSPISISGGIGYSINGGAFTMSDGFVANGQTVRVKVMSSASYETDVAAILYIGNKSASFDVTTTEAIGNDARSAEFRRECSAGQVGSMVEYTVDADVYFSDTKEKANLLRDVDFDADGQEFANDPSNGGTCTTATFRDFTLAQNYRRLDLTADSGAISCDINMSINYTVSYSGGGTSPLGNRSLLLEAGQSVASNNGGNITGLDPDDVINIISFTFTPNICSGDYVRINGQTN